MDSRRAARALHRAVQSLAYDRDKKMAQGTAKEMGMDTNTDNDKNANKGKDMDEDMPLDQRIVFMHIGP